MSAKITEPPTLSAREWNGFSVRQTCFSSSASRLPHEMLIDRYGGKAITNISVRSSSTSV